MYYYCWRVLSPLLVTRASEWRLFLLSWFIGYCERAACLSRCSFPVVVLRAKGVGESGPLRVPPALHVISLALGFVFSVAGLCAPIVKASDGIVHRCAACAAVPVHHRVGSLCVDRSAEVSVHDGVPVPTKRPFCLHALCIYFERGDLGPT